MFSDPGPAAPIPQESLAIVRVIDPATGYVVTKYVDRTSGLEVGLGRTQHLQKANAGFIPPAA